MEACTLLENALNSPSAKLLYTVYEKTVKALGKPKPSDEEMLDMLSKLLDDVKEVVALFGEDPKLREWSFKAPVPEDLAEEMKVVEKMGQNIKPEVVALRLAEESLKEMGLLVKGLWEHLDKDELKAVSKELEGIACAVALRALAALNLFASSELVERAPPEDLNKLLLHYSELVVALKLWGPESWDPKKSFRLLVLALRALDTLRELISSLT